MKLFLSFSLFWIVLFSCTSQQNDTKTNLEYDSQAYVGMTIIDGTGAQAQTNMTVIVKDGYIIDIGKSNELVPGEHSEVIDVKGKWLIPGLIDMHAHVTVLPVDSQLRIIEKYDKEASFEALKTMLGFGITTVRNPAGPTDDAMELKRLVATDSIIGPTIYTTGYALNRTKAFFGPFAATSTEEQIRKEVQNQVEQGVDFIKVYASLKPNQIQIAIDEAHKQGKKVIGHLQNTSWTKASDMGIDFITHAAPWNGEYLPEKLRASYRPTMIGRLFWLENVDYSQEPIQRMLSTMAKNNVSVDPTLIAFRTKFWGDDKQYSESENLRFAPELIKSIWKKATFTSSWTVNDYSRAKNQWKKLIELTRLMHQKGILLTAGSDFPNPWVVPGISLHQELDLLEESGIPVLEVLKIATLNGAISLGIEDQTGSIEVGKEADLIFLDKNPLENIEHTQSISFILEDGKKYEPQLLMPK